MLLIEASKPGSGGPCGLVFPLDCFVQRNRCNPKVRVCRHIEGRSVGLVTARVQLIEVVQVTSNGYLVFWGGGKLGSLSYHWGPWTSIICPM